MENHRQVHLSVSHDEWKAAVTRCGALVCPPQLSRKASGPWGKSEVFPRTRTLLGQA